MKQGGCLLDCFRKVTILLKPVKKQSSRLSKSKYCKWSKKNVLLVLEEKLFCKYKLHCFSCKVWEPSSHPKWLTKIKSCERNFVLFLWSLLFCLVGYLWDLQCMSKLLKYLLSPFEIATTQHIQLQLCVLPHTVFSFYILLNTSPVRFKVWALNNPFVIYFLLISKENNSFGLQNFGTNALVLIYFHEFPRRTTEEVRKIVLKMHSEIQCKTRA